MKWCFLWPRTSYLEKWKTVRHSELYFLAHLKLVLRNYSMWCVARFGISHHLAFVWSFKHMRMHAHAFFYLPVVSIRLNELAWHSNGSIKSQKLECQSNGLGVWTHSNLTTFECCFLISNYHENCNPMSPFAVIHHVPLRHETLSFPLQLNVFISSLCSLFIVYNLFKKQSCIYVFVWMVKMGLTALGVLLTYT